MEKDVSHI